eukprot:NODE_610_length_5431_cov_0.738560.p5 type:complete len:116 gc:universal NODE_610_length_5431_cov_0.738560:4310-4657(+)
MCLMGMRVHNLNVDCSFFDYRTRNPVLLTALHMLTQKNPSNSTQNYTHDQVQQKPPKNLAHATHSNPGDESKYATAPNNSSSAQETQSTDSSEKESYAYIFYHLIDRIGCCFIGI